MTAGGTGPRRLILLGSTGSIGTSTLDVLAHLEPEPRFDVVGLAAGANAERLAEQTRRWGVEHVAIARGEATGAPHVYSGPDAALELVRAVARPGDLVLAAMVGAAGLPATIAAIERGCDVALANKETLVAAGAIVMPLAREHGVELLPVDSEHSAIAQCLRGGRSIDEVERLVLTASGGPFRTWTAERMAKATVEEALDHPTWRMGPKVTIDSASMMNKALEVIEAHWLFGLPADRIDVVVHPGSVVHSFVEFVDGSVLAQLGPPDMRTPIQYALTWPDRLAGCSRRMDWKNLSSLVFEPVDEARFPSVALARLAIERGGSAGAVFNAANEIAVEAFLERRIPFGRILEVVREVLEHAPARPVASLDDVMAADAAARERARACLDGAGSPGITPRPAAAR